MLKKKKEYAIDHLKTTVGAMACPKCHSAFELLDNGLVCQNNHHFDLSKKGTIHFPLHHMESDYDHQMLEHRRNMIQKGLYQPIEKEIARIISNQGEIGLIVDMGAGEGSILERLIRNNDISGTKMGFDLSKDGMVLASDFSKEAFWFIGDVTNMPFKDESVDTLLNIFSPSHYEEMSRALKKEGLVIKVIPEEHYLKELRELFYYDEQAKQQYSNEKVYQKFLKDMQLIEEKRITYQFVVEKEDFQDVLMMSPMHWGASIQAKEHARGNYFQKLTIDVKILVGKKY
ncbi:putative RNA methyltransferase [Melissococcus sp. OM08-11BH]|uniref:putative RNA methyltransferase n=1 Tax=Melissococcus sp. OM08-11BH TaxID=2293110 RepID=UPI000E4D1634|nr:methyltransferase domain-containing protein [Melissococcus sp. OM08-11BH]RGI30200.1 methyltransferase domain-containing protein [Melissococcus sp. OM08-11BH]